MGGLYEFGLAFLCGYAPWREIDLSPSRFRAKTRSRKGTPRFLRFLPGPFVNDDRQDEGRHFRKGHSWRCCMRLLIIVMIGALLTAVGAAQDTAPSPAPPNVEIVSKSWRRELLNSKLDEDPFKANDQHRDREREQQQATLINKA